MENKFELKRVNFKDIDLKDQRFCLTHDLKKEVGHQLPILTREKPYRVLSGFHLLKKVGMNEKSTEALVLSEDKNEAELYLSSLEFLANQTLTDFDFAKIISLLKNQLQFEKEKIVAILSEVFCVSFTWKDLADYEKLWRLNDSLKEYFYSNGFSLKVTSFFFKFSKEDQEVLSSKVLSKLQLSQSDLKKVGQLLSSMIEAKDVSMDEIVQLPFVQEILESDNLSKKGKATRFIQSLFEMQNPILAKIENNLTKVKEKLPLDSKVTFEVPASYEEDYYYLKIRFKDKKDLEGSLDKITKKINAFSGVDEILELD